MNDFTIGQLTELCQSVYRGVKSCATIPIMNKDIVSAEHICFSENVKIKKSKLYKNWITLWIYINDEISDVIDLLPENPVTKADHYLLGSLFGYSNDAICNYLSKITE